MDMKKLVKWIVTDEDQIACIREVVDHRKGDLKTYVRRGIFYIPPDLAELDYVIEQLGTTHEELGITKDNIELFEDGFIIPVMDSRFRVLFYINYSFLRHKSRKYLNIYTERFKGKEQTLKIYGMHNTRKAIKEDRIVVVEGLFDVLRLEQYGIPAVAMLGTGFLPYHAAYFKRFKRVIYVPDNDWAGEESWRRFKNQIPTAEPYRIRGVHSDVDEFGKVNNADFKDWIGTLKNLGVKKQEG